MRRFVIDQIPPDHDRVVIHGPEAKHIAKVLRMRPQDHIIVADTKGNRYQAVILSACPSSVELNLLRQLPQPQSPRLHLTLCQALLKSKAMDLVVQKATELGAARIVPFTSERTVVRLRGERLNNKLRHWQEITRSATAQSDRPKPPEISPLASFDQVLVMERDHGGLRLILWEQELCNDFKDIIRAHEGIKEITAVVGPEGGFSQSEVELATEAGFVPATLGGRILRAETAAIVVCTLCLYEWGDLGLQQPHGA